MTQGSNRVRLAHVINLVRLEPGDGKRLALAALSDQRSSRHHAPLSRARYVPYLVYNPRQAGVANTAGGGRATVTTQ